MNEDEARLWHALRDEARHDEDARPDDPAHEQGGAVEERQLAGQLARCRGVRHGAHHSRKGSAAAPSSRLTSTGLGMGDTAPYPVVVRAAAALAYRRAVQ